MLTNAGDIYNELYCIFKNKYNKKINILNTKNRIKLDYKKLTLADYYDYPSEEEQEETITDANEFSKHIAGGETDIYEELFKRNFNFQRPSNIFNSLNNINDIEKNNVLVNAIICGLKDLKKEIKELPEEERKIEKLDNIVKLVEEILKFNKQNKKDKA